MSIPIECSLFPPVQAINPMPSDAPLESLDEPVLKDGSKIAFTVSRADEAALLSAIAVEAKGYWGYSAKQLEVWRSGLSTSPHSIETHTYRTIWLNSEPVGFFSIRKEDKLLNDLWLRPEAIGRGLGARAFEEIKRVAASLGLDTFAIISDPNAEGFYLHQGAQRVGETQSIPQGRMLPRLIYRLEPPS